MLNRTPNLGLKKKRGSLVINLNNSELVLSRTFRIVAVLAWIYWCFFALFTPVTLWDSNTYNIARLEVFARGGFWHNATFNDPRQIYMTWTFDSVHLLFRYLNFGESLPSFACFTGTLLVIYNVLLYRVKESTLWIICASMFAMPCLMFQATSTKPELAICFCLAMWVYALIRYSESPSWWYLAWGALAIGFAAGSKATGLIISPFLILGGIWCSRKSKKDILTFIVLLCVAFLLFGSPEIYLNNYFIFKNVLGPTSSDLRNRDGLGGALATFIRYVFANSSFGYESFFYNKPDFYSFWESLCRKVLALFHLSNKGLMYQWFFELNDSNIRFLRDGTENNSDYGLIGSISIWFSLLFVVINARTRSAIWYVISFGLLYLAMISVGIGWFLWTNRYLVAPFFCFVIGFIFTLENSKHKISKYFVRAVIIVSISLAPFTSFNRGPKDISEMVNDRLNFQLKERPTLKPIFAALTSISNSLDHRAKLQLYAGEDSWILPVFEIKNFEVTMGANKKIASGDFDYLLVLQSDLPEIDSKKYGLIYEVRGPGGYWGKSSYIFRKR